jgi:hypothetical protein
MIERGDRLLWQRSALGRAASFEAGRNRQARRGKEKIERYIPWMTELRTRDGIGGWLGDGVEEE